MEMVPNCSFCFIDDLVSGLIKAMDIEFTTPINLGTIMKHH